MLLDLIRRTNGEIRDFLRHETTLISSGTAENLNPLYKRLAEVEKLFLFLEKTEASPEISEYERNLTELKALLEQAQVDLTARRAMLQNQIAKLRSTSAWAQTLEQTR